MLWTQSSEWLELQCGIAVQQQTLLLLARWVARLQSCSGKVEIWPFDLLVCQPIFKSKC